MNQDCQKIIDTATSLSDQLAQKDQAIALLQQRVSPPTTIFDHLEFDTWLLAPGTAANTGSTGNTAVATQGTPGVNSAWFKLQPNGPYADAYWYRQLGPDAAKKTFKYEVSLMLPAVGDAAVSQAIELDIQQCIGGVVYNTGLQWDFAENLLRIWNRNGKAWVSTGQPCPRWAPGMWMRAILETHRDANAVYYDAITQNWNRIVLGQSFPAPHLGLSDMINCGLQMDGNKSASAYVMCRDAIRMTLT